MDIVEQLLQNNQAYSQRFDQAELASAPAKAVAVVACMDARLDIHKILGLQEGDAHVIRNAGGLVTDDALRSLLISQRLLGTRAVVVIQHTDCGMLTMREEEVRREVEEETGEPLPFPLLGFADLERETATAVTRIRSAGFLPHTDAVRGFIYDVATGSLQEVPPE